MTLPATLLLENARIWTANPAQPWARSILIEGNTVVALDPSDPPQDCERKDLQGRLCLPGLWDAHIHFYFWSLGHHEIKLMDASSKSDMLARVAARTDDSPHWLVGKGWNETHWSDPSLPHRKGLDAITGPERPSLLYRVDMHTALANTAALKLAGLLEPEAHIRGGVIERDAQGPTGILRELAINAVQNLVPKASDQETDRALKAGAGQLHKLGITGICDQRIKGQNEGPKCLASLGRLHQERALKLRVSCNVVAHHLPMMRALGVKTGDGDDVVRYGHLKIFADGTLGSRTAAVCEPYFKTDNTGLFLTPPDEIAQVVRQASRAGFSVSIHAIGDRANQVCLDALEKAEPLPIPHRLEHAQILQDEDIPRFAKLGITASLQPVHITDDMDIADAYLGARARLMHRLTSLRESGALLAFGSDAPVAEVNPFHGIHAAVTRQQLQPGAKPWQAQECLSLQDTLEAYTLGAATAAGWQDLTGSLEVGKRADLCVLDRDLFELATDRARVAEIAETQVLMTFFDGHLVYES